MKPLVLSALLLLSLGACQKEKDVQPTPAFQTEYAEWYALRAPDDRAIEAVSGNLDGTLVISTAFHIYQTKDRGKTWKQGNYPSSIGVMGFAQIQDTLLALTGQVNTAPNTSYATHPSVFSLDEGLTWQRYRNWRREHFDPRVARAVVTTPSGTEYSLAYKLTPTSPNSTSSYVETVGVNSSAGQQLTLPQEHQLKTLYLDKQSRLYVAGSAALCGRREKFAFCGEQNGVLYVSKKPQP
ncbi:hypothetical protein DNI29_10605 [Hymenobacter sediminis]|uniref:hypothetical protein n=1 Tax=Hymenobacter sediminis TaxID=2218621 RepID=UPI000F4D4778|nr:hypothetical protein [Hymenobacter sediminis]RPD47879.1 hypothetical protein DNI29_10605 [Hymenobacter sediminis]